jgi:hypothetical protein
VNNRIFKHVVAGGPHSPDTTEPNGETHHTKQREKRKGTRGTKKHTHTREDCAGFAAISKLPATRREEKETEGRI